MAAQKRQRLAPELLLSAVGVLLLVAGTVGAQFNGVGPFGNFFKADLCWNARIVFRNVSVDNEKGQLTIVVDNRQRGLGQLLVNSPSGVSKSGWFAVGNGMWSVVVDNPTKGSILPGDELVIRTDCPKAQDMLRVRADHIKVKAARF